MSRPDPNATLARNHASHTTPQFGCPRCMRTSVADRLPRWAQPRSR